MTSAASTSTLSSSAANFQLPSGCDQLEAPAFVNCFGDLASLPDAAGADGGGVVVPPTHRLAATNLLAARRLRDLLVLPSRTREPYGAVVRLLDDTKHLAAVSDRRRDTHPCPVAIGAGDPAPRWLTLSLRIRVADVLVAGGGSICSGGCGGTSDSMDTFIATASASAAAAVPDPELWVFDSLLAFPLTPTPPLFRLPFKVSDLRHITSQFFQPRAESWWRRDPDTSRRVLARPHLTPTQSNWFYARLSAFAFYVYCVNLPPYAVWGAMRLFFDRVETIVCQKQHLELDADQLERVNPNLHAAWGAWNAQMAMFAYWFVALYQAQTICPTVDLAAVRLRSGAVSADVIQDPFQELLAFLYDASQYWPAMHSCQGDFSDLEPLLVPVQRVSVAEAATRLQSRMCLRDVNAFLQRRLPGEETEAGAVCYRLADMLPSHLRETLVRLGFEADDVASVVMAPYFVGAAGGGAGSENHGYDLFVRMHAGHECAWQAASVCQLERGARPLLQRLGCASRVCVRNRPSLVRTIQRAVVRLFDVTIELCAADAATLAVTTAYAAEELRFIRDMCGPQPRFSATLVFLCAMGLHVPFVSAGDTVTLRAATGVSDAHMQRSLSKWRAALAKSGSIELLADDLRSPQTPMSTDRFRVLLRATAPLLRDDANLNIFVHLACSNPLLGDSYEMCSVIEEAGELLPSLPRLHAYEGIGTSASGGGSGSGNLVTRRCDFRWTRSVLEYVLMLQSPAADDTTTTTTDNQSCVQAMVRVIETLNAMRRGTFGLAPLLSTDEMQNVGWFQTNDDFSLLREREVQARVSGGMPAARPIEATRSLALFPDQCALVYASMRNCPSVDDLVAELLMGPEHKCNWDASNANDTHYSIIKAVKSSAAAARTEAERAEARAKAHFGEGSVPLLRLNYPESMRQPTMPSRKSTLPMSSEEVRLAEQEQHVGRSSWVAGSAAAPPPLPTTPAPTPPPPPPRQQPKSLPPPVPAPVPTAKSKRSRAAAAAAAAAPRTIQLNCAGKLVSSPGGGPIAANAKRSRAAATTTTPASAPPARSSNLGYAVMSQYME